MKIISVLLLVSGAIAANIRGSENVGPTYIPTLSQESLNAIIRHNGQSNVQPLPGTSNLRDYNQVDSRILPGSIDAAFWEGIYGGQGAIAANIRSSGNVGPTYIPTLRQVVPIDLSIVTPPMFAFYCRGANQPDMYQFNDAVKILKNPNFDSQKKTVIYIHGFLEGLFVESVQHVIRAYLKRNDFNVIILDWHSQALPEYFAHAVPQVSEVGKKAAEAILDMIYNGLSTDKLHVVGHSLGGQMAGVIGREIQRLSRGSVTLKRIFALDPAYPGFYGMPGKEPLNEDDAEYVVVIHTDAGVYGAPGNTGTVDFWPNGGRRSQPGCADLANNICSHQRSWWFWTESLVGNKFNAIKSLDWDSFRRGVCDSLNVNVTMGIDTPDNLYGSYYLQTNLDSPYARGELGAGYVDEFDTKVQSPRTL